MTDTKEKSGEFPRFTATAGERTKIGRLRDLFDEIEGAKRLGWRYEHILLGLSDQGLEVSLNTLKDALKRIRAERKLEPVVQQTTPKKEAVKPPPQAADKPSSGTQASSSRKISSDGFREPVHTFTRDVTKRTNLDEE
ncbi:hypothetical protein [Burkholderia vietnamiensis]|uniref:hypothetical protein n=1 Tax=Burkholderia vietnamiensis TaxID=60552 RepID=UPI0015947607|nr:hypothetical protein [Burkholderia vietnamiensis]